MGEIMNTKTNTRTCICIIVCVVLSSCFCVHIFIVLVNFIALIKIKGMKWVNGFVIGIFIAVGSVTSIIIIISMSISTPLCECFGINIIVVFFIIFISLLVVVISVSYEYLNLNLYPNPYLNPYAIFFFFFFFEDVPLYKFWDHSLEEHTFNGLGVNQSCSKPELLCGCRKEAVVIINTETWSSWMEGVIVGK